MSQKGRHHIKETLLSPTTTTAEVGEIEPVVKDISVVEQAPTTTRGRPLSIISRSNSRSQSKQNSRSNSLSCFGSRRGSHTRLAGLVDSKAAGTSNGPVDVDAAIKILQEVKRNASPEDLAALQEAWDSSDEAVQVIDPAISKRLSMTHGSSVSVTRRRSLVTTPGVATRNSPVDGRRRTWNSWRTPDINTEEAAKWRTPTKAPPSLTRLTAVAWTEDDADSARAQTPGELDYSSLGALQLGSLVVTNGAPSPAPSAKVPKMGSRPSVPDDYFADLDGDSSPLMMKSPRKRGHSKSKSASLPSITPIHSESRRADALTAGSSSRQPRMQAPLIITPDVQEMQAETPKQLRVMNKSSETLRRVREQAREAKPAFPSITPEVGNVSGQQQIFELEGTTVETDVAQMFTGTIFAEPSPMAPSKVSNPTRPATSSGVRNFSKQRNVANERPPARTADSGYSSGGSLKTRHSGEHARPTSSTKRREARLELDTAKVLLTPTTSILKQQARKPEYVSSAETSRRPPSLLIPDTAGSSVKSPVSSSLLSPQTPRSMASKASFESSSSISQKRLQKSRSPQPEPPVVQSCQPILEGTIPEVPNNVRAQFTRRLSHTPELECLTHTYASKDHEVVDEAISDVFTRTFTPLSDLESSRPPTASSNGTRRSLSLFRRRSSTLTKKKEADYEDESGATSMVDLGNIAAALGQSPYDAALTAAGPRRKSVTATVQPYQVGANLPRVRSMVSMDSQAAAELARIRSKDIALMQRENAQRELAQRELGPLHRRSYHHDRVEQDIAPHRRRSQQGLRMEADEGKALKRRSRSFYQEVPPVPSIDTSRFPEPPHSALPRMEQGSQLRNPATLSVGAGKRGQVVSQLVTKHDLQDQGVSPQPLNWDTHASAWRMRRKSMESLRAQEEMAQASAPKELPPLPQRPDSMADWGRYSGGLGYGYEGRGVGIGGSAGTRSLHTSASNKTMTWRSQYGVDMSDVPIILQQQRVAH